MQNIDVKASKVKRLQFRILDNKKGDRNMTKANEFVEYMINRCKVDSRLVSLIGPMNKAYNLMVGAYAEAQGLDAEEFKDQYAKILRACQKWQEA